MYTPHKLHPEPMILHSKRSDGETMTLTLKPTADLTPGDYAYIQVFNILMRKCYSSLKLQLLGRDFYDRLAKIDIREHKLQIWPGYKTTIAQHEKSILMVAEITHKVIRTDTVLDNIIAAQASSKSNYQSSFTKEIVGQIVLTDYNNKTYRITDVDWKASPKSTFPLNGENISYVEYYKKKYQIVIRDYNQPLLVSRAKPRDIRRGCSEMVLLIPELSRMTGLTDKMRSNFPLMKALSNYTRVSPESRVNKLLNFNKRIQSTPECVEDLENWDMKLDNNLADINGRQLPPENIIQGIKGDIRYHSEDTFDGWTKRLRNNQFVSAAPVQVWAVFYQSYSQQNIKSFIQLVMKAGNAMGFRLPEPIMCYVNGDSISQYLSEMEKVISQKNPAIVFCVVSTPKADLYNAIKRKCCVDRAVPSQVVVSRNLVHKSSMSIATKIAIQMNCKLGGAPWTTQQPIKHLMTIGYDVCHDPRDKRNSYGAMVCSVNQHHTKYFSCTAKHNNGEELASEFCINMRKSLQKYHSINKTLPNIIIIYRDGVGEGQIPFVYEYEVSYIKKTLEEVYNGPNYKLQFNIVSKRLNTRFFLKDTHSNPKPGTIVDDIVTNPNRYDFFLVSQPVRDGTVAPTSYNVIFDNSGLSADYTQRLAYKFCHMYYNVSGQVRVPAPCQYAHKLAFLASQNLHSVPNQALNSVLFFL